mmetsp:Transcript_19697/g.78422  ORF Transcript_19697/g.78422 Transcript_19697/m.78422 type:complete len:545 (+) Transcript_19697:3-1637(+)
MWLLQQLERESKGPPLATLLAFHVPVGTHRVGRTKDAPITIPDKAVSRTSQAVVEVTTEKLFVTDLGNACGTFVDGRRLAKDERVELAVGSTVRFGNQMGKADFQVRRHSWRAACFSEKDAALATELGLEVVDAETTSSSSAGTQKKKKKKKSTAASAPPPTHIVVPTSKLSSEDGVDATGARLRALVALAGPAGDAARVVTSDWLLACLERPTLADALPAEEASAVEDFPKSAADLRAAGTIALRGCLVVVPPRTCDTNDAVSALVRGVGGAVAEAGDVKDLLEGAEAHVLSAKEEVDRVAFLSKNDTDGSVGCATTTVEGIVGAVVAGTPLAGTPVAELRARHGVDDHEAAAEDDDDSATCDEADDDDEAARVPPPKPPAAPTGWLSSKKRATTDDDPGAEDAEARAEAAAKKRKLDEAHAKIRADERFDRPDRPAATERRRLLVASKNKKKTPKSTSSSDASTTTKPRVNFKKFRKNYVHKSDDAPAYQRSHLVVVLAREDAEERRLRREADQAARAEEAVLDSLLSDAPSRRAGGARSRR